MLALFLFDINESYLSNNGVQIDCVYKRSNFYRGIIVTFSSMDFKEKLKRYLIPVVAGALFLVAAATVTIFLIIKRSGKVDSATTGKQTKERKDDVCVTLLAEYVKAAESGMSKEELKGLYAKGSTQCPTDFVPLQQQGELLKLEEVQARLAKKQEEKKAVVKLKDERAKAKSECTEMIKGMLATSKPENLINAFTKEQRKRIKKLVNEGLIPKYYNEDVLVKQFWAQKIQKSLKTGNTKEAQEAYVHYAQSSGQTGNADVTQLPDYKLWTAIANEKWAEAEQLLEQWSFIPSFIRDAAHRNPEKLKFLKELDDVQLDALMEYCTWNNQLVACSKKYSREGDERKMTDLRAEYSKVSETMRLLHENIHRDFDFAIPDLPAKKSAMQELDEYMRDKEKLPGFEAAFLKLKEDKSYGMLLIIDVMYNLKKPEDQVALLETMQKLKRTESIDLALLDVLVSAAKKEPVEDRIRLYLSYLDNNNFQHLAAISEALERIIMGGGSPLNLAILNFWKLFVSFVDIVNGLSRYAFNISPFTIEDIGRLLSNSNIGAEGIPLLEQCAFCIKTKYESEPTVEHKAEHDFAQGYLKIYKAAKGANLEEQAIVDQINALKSS